MKLPADQKVKIDDILVEYEKFFAFSVDMLCISSYDGHFKKVNPAFEKTLGLTAEELCTKSYLDFIHPDDIERTTREVEKQLLTKQDVISFENRYRCSDGTYKWLSWNSAPVGEFMYAVARDITEKKKAHEELLQTKESLEILNRELESFSYSVAHDLRAPVRSIMGFSSFVMEDPTSQLSSEAKSFLTKVINSSKKMGILIEGLLNLSRLSRKEIVKQPVNLSETAQEVVQELQSQDPSRPVNFVIAKDIGVSGDPLLLRLVLLNLMGNSWKYSSKSNHPITIEFGSHLESGKQVLFVRDNGAGFDMKYADKLFGVFHRLHSDQEFEGHGIGLATVQRILQRHGGKIWAMASVGKGATFYFTL
jgi:PAS domain S-box-containing protein